MMGCVFVCKKFIVGACVIGCNSNLDGGRSGKEGSLHCRAKLKNVGQRTTHPHRSIVSFRVPLTGKLISQA